MTLAGKYGTGVISIGSTSTEGLAALATMEEGTDTPRVTVLSAISKLQLVGAVFGVLSLITFIVAEFHDP